MTVGRSFLAGCIAALLAAGTSFGQTPASEEFFPRLTVPGQNPQPDDPPPFSRPGPLLSGAFGYGEDGEPAATDPFPRPVEHSRLCDWLGPVCYERLGRDVDYCCEDYEHYYSWGNLGMIALGVGIAAPLANTRADEHFARWYQKKIRGETTDEYAQVMNYAGQFWLVLPVCLEGCALMGKTDEDYALEGGLYEWTNRSLRSIVVGVPPMLAMYAVLGSHRPDRHDSNWHPFNDVHGVSGHTFMGAVPFLTAMEMSDNIYFQTSMLAGSFLTGWSRINNDRHYLSQVVLGWWLAYWSCHCVDQTQEEHKRVYLAPVISPDNAGFSIEVKF